MNNLHALLANLPQPVKLHIQHLERMRQDFIANVSHELRTPLTVIHGYLEILMEQDFAAKWQMILTQMYQQTLRMENLIGDLLLLSSLETEEENHTAQQLVDVPELLMSIVEEARILSGTANHAISVQTNRTLKLYGHENELRSLFSNVVFNAVKYTPANGAIDVKWYLKKHHAYFQVKDSGIGIAKKHIPRITERFYRIDEARSRESGGTGLGLAIAKHVLLRHQGRLKVTSKVDVGSTFTCIFPPRIVKLDHKL